jgi:KaiC/GvpD/RAD55 family RecA-like ATPase/tetratricopeptide (TPR) repeat protein
VELKTGVLAEPVLVGREDELGELQELLNSATKGKGSTIFISGEAGAGKTRLTTEFLNKAKKQGITTLTGWCLSNAAVPYFPFFEAFNAYFTEEKNKENADDIDVTDWLKGPSQAEKVGKTQAFSAQVWKDQTFAAVAKTLTIISAGKPIILFIDDIHWADSASLALIHYIARAIRSEKILLVATFRSEELTADAEGRPHPLVETMRLMRREDLFKQIKVPNLNQTSVSNLAKSMLGSDLQQQFAEKLAEESQGNPLFIVESLRMLHERDELFQEDDKWRLTREDLGIPDKIKDIILQRLSVLLHKQRRMLDAASVIGEKFDAELLAWVLSQDYLEVADALDMIGQATSMVCCEGESYRFDHARSRDAIYDGISPALKRGYHAKVAEKLESTGKNGKLAFSELAYHYAQAGNIEKAVKYSLAAGQEALARFSNTEALKHFNYVLHAASDSPENNNMKSLALEGVGDAYHASCMFEEATKTFVDLANSETGNMRIHAYNKAMEAVWAKEQDAVRLMELVALAEKVAATDRLEKARVRWNRGRALIWLADAEGSVRDHEEALRVFEEESSLPDAAQLILGAGIPYIFLDSQEKGVGMILRAIALFHELNDFRGEIIARVHGGGEVFALCCGLFQEARNNFENALRIGAKIGEFDKMAQACIGLGEILEQEGCFAEALSISPKMLEYSKQTESRGIQSQIYSGIVRQYARLGNLPKAEEYFEQLMKLPPETLSHPRNVTYVVLAKAVFLAAKGQWEEAEQNFQECLGRPQVFKPPVIEAFMKEHYSWALSKQGRVEEAKVLLREIQRTKETVEKRFGHANIQVGLMTRREIKVGEKLEMRLDIVNVGRKPAVLIKAEGVIPSQDFEVCELPPWCSLQNGIVEMKLKGINPFRVEVVNLHLKALKAGSFTMYPQVEYVNDLGDTETFKLAPINITVQPTHLEPLVLPGRMSTGFAELDRLFLGGIPEHCTLVLAAPSSDERELLIHRFLESGYETGQTVLYVTCQAGKLKDLLQQFQTNFRILVCSTQADTLTQNSTNVFKLNGIDSLTEIGIALMKVFRTLDSPPTRSKRACIDLISDVLLQHHAVTTRKWLNDFLLSLKLNGFTTLAVVDPHMHTPEEVQAILGLFDGEIRISEKQNAKGIMEKVLKIRRLYNQKYLEDELTLTKELLGQ